MPHIVLGTAGVGDFFLQILILHRLHRKLMILFLQLQRLVLFQKAGHDIVDQDCSHIDDK